MITIEITGLDMFGTRSYSLMFGEGIAKEFGVNINEIFFTTNEGAIFNKGAEQGSWNVMVKVLAPAKYEKIEKNIANKILNTITELAVHAHILFEYYNEQHLYCKINPDYPPFLAETEENQDYDDECDCDNECDCEDGCNCGEDHECGEDCCCDDEATDDDEDDEPKCCCHKHG